MFACLILGLPLMLLFEYPLTRFAGVVLCLGFIVVRRVPHRQPGGLG